MIKSMTGFGRSEYSDERLKITVEMKSVNNRYLDLNVKMPRQLARMEAQIKAVLKEYMQRGKVDVYISCEDLAQAGMTVRYNSRLAGEYVAKIREMAEQFGLDFDLRASALARFPDVLTMEEEPLDDAELWDCLEKALRSAAEQFADAREREGTFLREDLEKKLDEMTGHVAFITERSPGIVEAYRRRLEEKVRDLLDGSIIEESRIVQEVTLYADKVCVDEELVRLSSHIQAVRAALRERDGVGRKLDFLAQEMNRESNTILSKSDDREVSDHAIELKTCVEKIREQIQNIE